jgi:hypothetical protein
MIKKSRSNAATTTSITYLHSLWHRHPVNLSHQEMTFDSSRIISELKWNRVRLQRPLPEPNMKLSRPLKVNHIENSKNKKNKKNKKNLF